MNRLHQAVIQSDRETVIYLSTDTRLLQEKDRYGFTPLDLAHLLGKRGFLLHLGGRSPPEHIYFQDQCDNKPVLRPLVDFENQFSITYRESLTFTSYSHLIETIHNCPYVLRSHFLAKDNYYWAEKYAHQLDSSTIGPVYVKWIDHTIGYGLCALEDIPQGAYIGEYTGCVREIASNPNAYCFHYPTRWWSWKKCVIDALKEGNILRFINHSENPNLQPFCLVNRRLLHFVFIAKRDISKGTELTFTYWHQEQQG